MVAISVRFASIFSRAAADPSRTQYCDLALRLAAIGGHHCTMKQSYSWSNVVSRMFSAESADRRPEADLGRIAGTPEEHLRRKLKIYRPAATSMQQGGKGIELKMWTAIYDKLEDGDRWVNPLMGWTSTADPVSNLKLQFPSKEEAIEYAKKYGYEYVVEEPEEPKENVRKFTPYGKSMVHQWRHKLPKYEQ